MKIGDKVRIIGIKSSFSEAEIKGEEGILGRYDEAETGEPDLIYLEDGDCEFLDFVEVELVPTTVSELREFI